MTEIFHDNFESGGFVAGGWSLSTGGGGWPGVYLGCMEGRYYASAGVYCEARKELGSYSQLWFQTIIGYASGYYSGRQAFTIWSGSTKVLQAFINGTDIWFSCGGISLGSVHIGGWYTLDIYHKPDPVNGVIQIKVNGNLEIDYSGRTVPGSQTTLTALSFGDVGAPSSVLVDNIRVSDSGWFDLPGSDISMGNRFDIDPNCLMAWVPEYLDPKKDISSFGVTKFWPNVPGVEINNPLKGHCSAHIIHDVYFSIADSDTPLSWPFRNGSTNRKGSYTFWYRNDDLSQCTGTQDVFAKGDDYSIAGSFIVRVVSGSLKLLWHNSGGTTQWFTICSITQGHDYHIALVIDGDAKTWKFRIHDKTAGTVNNYTGTASQTIFIDGSYLWINVNGGPGNLNSCEWWLDEFCVFDLLLEDNQIDEIYNDTYGSISPGYCRSETTCEDTKLPLGSCRSDTTCGSPILEGPESAISETTAEEPGSGAPASCISETTCQNLKFNGGNFFLAM